MSCLPQSVVREIAASLGSERLGPLVEGPYWQQVKRRALDAAQGLSWTDRVEGIVSGLAAKWSGVDVIHCTSHGDFAPWNMARSAGSLDLWDWERASESRPLGVDPLHFCSRSPITSKDEIRAPPWIWRWNVAAPSFRMWAWSHPRLLRSVTSTRWSV